MKYLSMKDSPGYRTSFPVRQECSGIHGLLRHSPSLAVSGPIFHFSDTWQLVINMGTTIVTFLMVFLIQNAQNRDGAEIQAKLDELIRASTASNRFIGIESLTQEEVDEFRAKCAAAAKTKSRALEKTNSKPRKPDDAA